MHKQAHFPFRWPHLLEYIWAPVLEWTEASRGHRGGTKCPSGMQPLHLLVTCWVIFFIFIDFEKLKYAKMLAYYPVWQATPNGVLHQLRVLRNEWSSRIKTGNYLSNWKNLNNWAKLRYWKTVFSCPSPAEFHPYSFHPSNLTEQLPSIELVCKMFPPCPFPS